MYLRYQNPLVQNPHCYEKPESGIGNIRQSTNITILRYLAAIFIFYLLFGGCPMMKYDFFKIYPILPMTEIYHPAEFRENRSKSFRENR